MSNVQEAASPVKSRVTEYTLWLHGRCEPNPGGEIGIGWRCASEQGPQGPHGRAWFAAAPENTNNAALFLAAIVAFEELNRIRRDRLARGLASERVELEVCSDASLLINALRGEHQVGAPHLIPLYGRTRGLICEAETLGVKVVGYVRLGCNLASSLSATAIRERA